MTPSDVIAVARAALGTPFRHQGRTAGSALDCAGFLGYVVSALGGAVVDQQGYSRRPSGGLLQAALDSQPAIYRVAGPPQSGDFVLMKFENDNEPSHLGIVADGTLIHAWAVAKKVCEHAFDESWQRRVVRVYRLRGLSDGG